MTHLKKQGFSLIELILVIAIISILSVVAYLSIQRVRERSYNDKMLGDLPAIANVLEQYAADHDGKFPIPSAGGNQNLLCYDSNAVYAHDCTTASFIQGFVDNTLLGTRYLSEIPLDPWTGSRYAYGVTVDGKYFQVAGLWKEDDGSFSVRTADNLYKGFSMPSLLRAFDGPNFVVQRGNYLPYPSNAKELSVTFTGAPNVTVNSASVTPGEPVTVFQNDTIFSGPSSLDLYFSDGSIVTLDPATTLKLTNLEVPQNDSATIITKIKLFLSSGRLWAKVVRLASQSEFRVETTTAIAGVRGTEFGIGFADSAPVVKSGEVWTKSLPPSSVPRDDSVLPDRVEEQSLPAIPATPYVPSGWSALASQNILRFNGNLRPRIIELHGDKVIVENIYKTLHLDPFSLMTVQVTGIEIKMDGPQSDPYEGEGVQTVSQPIPNPSDKTNNYTFPVRSRRTSSDPYVFRNFTLRFYYDPPPPRAGSRIYSAPTFPPLGVMRGAGDVSGIITSRDIEESPGSGSRENRSPELKLIAPESVTLARSGSSAPSASFTMKLKFGNTTRSDLDPSGSSGTSALPSVSLIAVPSASCQTGSLSSFSYDPATLRPNPMEATVSVTSPSSTPADFTCAFTASVLRSGETVPFMTAVKTVTVKAPRAAAAAAAPVVTSVFIYPPAGHGTVPPVNENFVMGVTSARTYRLRVILDSGTSGTDPRAEDNAACTKTPMNPVTGASAGPAQTLSVDSSSGATAGQFTLDPPDDTPGKFRIECAAGPSLDRKRAGFTAWVFRPSADNSKIYSLKGSVNTWDAATTACGTMRDGGYSDWTLPAKAFLETNKATWCNYDTGTTSCLNMPEGTGQYAHWAESFDTTQAWKIPGTVSPSYKVSKTAIPYGYRCIRSAP